MFQSVKEAVGKKILDRMLDLGLVAISAFVTNKLFGNSKSSTQYQSRKSGDIVYLALPDKDTVYIRGGHKKVFLCMSIDDARDRSEGAKKQENVNNPKKEEELAEEELSRAIGLFVERYKSVSTHGEKVLTYKDIVCSFGGDLEDLSPNLSAKKRQETSVLGKYLKEFVHDEITAEKTATYLYTSIISNNFM